MKKILAVPALLALVFGGAFAAEVAVTVDYASDAFRVEATKKGNTTFSSFTDSSGTRENDDYTGNAISFSVKDETYGATLALGFADDTRQADVAGNGAVPALGFVEIDRLSAWIRIAGILQFEAGKFTDRKADGLTAVIDDYKLGVHSYAATGGPATDGNAEWVTPAYETERLAGPFLAGIYIPGTDWVIEWAAIDQTFLRFNRDGDNVSGAANGLLTQTGARVRGTVAEGIGLTLTYRWTNEAYDGGAGYDAFPMPAAFSRDGRQYRNNFGVYLNIDTIERLRLLVGYGATVRYVAQDKDYIKNIMGFDGLSNAGSFYSGIDLRAEYALAGTVTLATHNNVSFGSHGFKDAETNANSVYGAGVKVTRQKSNFILDDAVAVRIGLTDTVSLTPKIRNVLTLATADGSTGAAKNVAKYSRDRFEISAVVGYAPGGNVSVRAGLGFGIDSESTEKRETAAGTTTSHPEPAVTKFWIPVGITVKF
jgi:hypothetical protein